MDMPEIEREEILAGRLEEMQRIQDKRNLDAMLRSQRHGGADLDDSVAKSAKRGHCLLLLVQP
jgi:RNA polymerase-associated protein RTF1